MYREYENTHGGSDLGGAKGKFPSLTTREYLAQAVEDVKRENPKKRVGKQVDLNKAYVFPNNITQDIESVKQRRKKQTNQEEKVNSCLVCYRVPEYRHVLLN